MARFYAEIEGARGPASRLGHTHSGIRSHTRGWSVGIRVLGGTNREDTDRFDVYLTNGSNGRGPDVFIGSVTEENMEQIRAGIIAPRLVFDQVGD